MQSYSRADQTKLAPCMTPVALARYPPPSMASRSSSPRPGMQKHSSQPAKLRRKTPSTNHSLDVPTSPKPSGPKANYYNGSHNLLASRDLTASPTFPFMQAKRAPFAAEKATADRLGPPPHLTLVQYERTHSLPYKPTSPKHDSRKANRSDSPSVFGRERQGSTQKSSVPPLGECRAPAGKVSRFVEMLDLGPVDPAVIESECPSRGKLRKPRRRNATTNY
ncbi:unnamed protein product [Somion occarium]|uniref:Uncharacterized protein n=1 Tax=Somion occarium TaxID=3059160 RepID=A0ABP1EBP7_9APHY